MVNSKELFESYRLGQAWAARAIFDRYAPRMISLASGRIGPQLKRRFDADDVVQSAFRSFFVHAIEGQYQIQQSGDLWRLLASISIHKLHRQIERQMAAKRSVACDASTHDCHNRLLSQEPTADEAVALAEELQLIIDQLEPEERLVFTTTLEGKTVEDIAGSMGKSARTVRRILAGTKRKLEQRLLNDTRSQQEAELREFAPPTPFHFADYLLQEMIGAGGMGKVYRALEKPSGKIVAIKALHKSRQFDRRAVALFAQEATVLSKLHHPNIVGVKGLGRFPGGGYFIVMDLIDGVDLESLLRQGPVPLDRVIEIVKEVARAIHHAHEQGIVHSDLKPGNILLDQRGRVFVSDFGFAFLIADSLKANRQVIGGTAGYIAPEVLLGKSKPSPAADVYALGMLLFTLATGNGPNESAFLHEADSLPEFVRPIYRRCVAENPEDRYPSAKELAEALEADVFPPRI